MSDWTEVKISVNADDIEKAGDIASMVVPYGIYIEDYSDSARVLFIGFSVDFIKRLFEDCRTAEFSQEKEILKNVKFVVNYSL